MPDSHPFHVSVVIPCRNAGRWIYRALESVAGQTHPPLEVIVVDDGSTDDSAREVARSGVAVTMLAGRWGNAAAARNAGIRASRGDWIAFLDADDVWYPEHLARARQLLQAGPAIAFMANHDWIDDEDRVIEMPVSLRHDGLEAASALDARRFPEILSRGFHFGHSTVLVRRDRTLAIGGFDENLVRRHDLDHWLRQLEGQAWSYDSRPQAGYRVGTPGSLSKDTVQCEIAYLRALLKNLKADYDTVSMHSLVRTSARRAMSLSFVDGTEEEFRLARSLSWPHLSRSLRAVYRLSSPWPQMLRWGIKAKRAVRSLVTSRR